MPEVALPTIPNNACRHKPRARDLSPGEVLCNHCPGKCCRYFALPIDTPTEWADYDYIRWYLLHEHAAVFIEDDCWYLLVQNRSGTSAMIISATSTTPGRRFAATTQPPTANTTTTGPMSTIGKQPSKSRNTPKRCWVRATVEAGECEAASGCPIPSPQPLAPASP